MPDLDKEDFLLHILIAKAYMEYAGVFCIFTEDSAKVKKSSMNDKIYATACLDDKVYGPLSVHISVHEKKDPYIFALITEDEIRNLFVLAKMDSLESIINTTFATVNCETDKDVAHIVKTNIYTEAMYWYFVKAKNEARQISISEYGLTPDDLALVK